METPNFRESKPSYLKLSPELQKTIQDFSQQKNLEKQKQSQKENLHHKTNDSLQKLANTVYVEINGQEMTLEEFDKKYPKFSKKSGKNFVQSGEISDAVISDYDKKQRIEESFVSEEGGATDGNGKDFLIFDNHKELEEYYKKMDEEEDKYCTGPKLSRSCPPFWEVQEAITFPSTDSYNQVMPQQTKNIKKGLSTRQVQSNGVRNNISSPGISSPSISSKPVSRPSDSNVIVIKNHKGNSVEIGGGKAGRIEINGVEY